MTDKQLEQKKYELAAEMASKGYGWVEGKFKKPPEEYVLRRKELYCIGMINSILCYNCKGYTDAEKVLEYEESAYHNYLSEYVNELGRDKVIALIQGQIDSIRGIKENVFEDDEGLTYNSIVWKE